MAKIALHLGGGGARGAYQIGTLKALAEILQVKTLPFSMVTGVSVGSINTAILAQHADDFRLGVQKLESIWLDLHCHNIFNTSNYELGKSVFRNLSYFMVKQREAGHLLDTTPLHKFINDHVDFTKINANIESGLLDTIEIISNCYETQQTTSFYQHHELKFVDWDYPRHISKRVYLDMHHLLASSSLPLFFPTVKIDDLHYGDGSMGLVAPLRGAIRFNVDKILVLGTRPLPSHEIPEHLDSKDIGFAHVLGNMLTSLFLDNLDRDLEMVNRMNDIAERLSMWKKWNSPWRPIETLNLCPSISFAPIAQKQYHAMPALLRFLLNVLGAKSHSGDLLSFLLFEKDFTAELIDLGYQDTLAAKEQIITFFS